MNNENIYDPYFRENPGHDAWPKVVYEFDFNSNFHEWKFWRTNDGRILPNSNCKFELISNPFSPGYLVQLTTSFDPSIARKSFGGFGIRIPLTQPVKLIEQSFIEFDLYYPKSAAGKYMRLEFWSTSTGGEGSQANTGEIGTCKSQCYIRTDDLDDIGNLAAEWMDFYSNDTWYRKSIRVATPVSSGTWEFLNIDIHTESATKVDKGLLLLGNIKISQTDLEGVIPDVVNEKSYLEVPVIKEKYNPENGWFYIGAYIFGSIEPGSISERHFQIFTDKGNLKPQIHVKPPKWLKDLYPDFKFNMENDFSPEWDIATIKYIGLRDSKYLLHANALACTSYSSLWMRQIIPENVHSIEWKKDGYFYTNSNNSSPPFLKLPKEQARRLYYDHIMFVMRHFMTTDPRYNSSKERGIIPFHSYDVINTEIHESRFSSIIPEMPNEWKSALRNTSWLMAMTDKDFHDNSMHYIYLLFKYAHIAVPNKQMAEKFKTFYNDPNVIPDYLKQDRHDKNGSIDDYITEKPPILVFNEFVTTDFVKMRVAYNMIKELNNLWKEDPLYDGRNLIECIGIQGHEFVDSAILSQNLRVFKLITGLIDDGLLNSICFSEMDMKQFEGAPGGSTDTSTGILTQKQADSIGYQYALFFKLFEKYKKYIDHVIFSGECGVIDRAHLLFDHEKKASQAYYAIMDPDRFIKGHSYLDYYFKDEYDKIREQVM